VRASDASLQESTLTRLDRKVSKAIVNGRGIRLSADELDTLAIIGAVQLLSDATAKALTAAAKQRQEKKNSPG